MSGSEAGLDGTLLARYSFVFDGADQGHYGIFNVNGKVQNFRLSNDFNLDDHSRIFLDFVLTDGNVFPYAPSIGGNFKNQYMELTYEVQF